MTGTYAYYTSIDYKTALMFLIWFIPMLAGSAWVMSRKHPGEVYLVWYIHALFLLLFTVLELFAQREGNSLTAICRPSFEDTCKAIHEALTNFNGEIKLVSSAVAVIIGPQLLTYVVSGFFGCASTPLFIWTSMKLGMWSVIKFLAGLGGILIAQPLAAWLLSKPVTLGMFVPGIGVTAYAFLYGMVLVLYEVAGSWLHKKLLERKNWRIMRLLLWVHAKATRNKPKKEPYPYFIEIPVKIEDVGEAVDVSGIRIRSRNVQAVAHSPASAISK